MGRMDRLDERLTAIRDTTVNMETASHVRTAGKSTRQEMRGLGDVVTVMQRQIHRLQSRVDDLDATKNPPA